MSAHTYVIAGSVRTLLMDDNVRVHTARIAMDFLADEGINLM